MQRIQQAEPIPPRTINEAIPTDLNTICLHALKKDPDKIPVIVNECSEDLRERLRRKMLIESEMTVGQYIHSLRNKFSIRPEESILIFVNGSFPTSSTLMSDLYNKNKDKDGLLYISLLKENVFG